MRTAGSGARALAIALGMTLAAIGGEARAELEVAALSERCGDETMVTVDRVVIAGLSSTKPYVVERELPLSQGHSRASRAAWDLGETRLWNLGIFSRVAIRLEHVGSECVARVEVEERFTLNPLLRYAFGGRALYFGLGAEDSNLAGRYLLGSALYEYFDGFHGGELTFKEPRLFDRRQELIVQGGRLVRPRPGFVDARAGARVEVAAYSRDDVFRVGFRVDVFGDRFLDPIEGPPQRPDETETVAATALLRVGRVDTVRIRQRGASLELRPTAAKLFSSRVADAFAQMQVEALMFALAGQRWNFAARVRAGTTTAVPAHLELYVGGLDLLRGFPDNHFRTRAFALANLEARFTAFDSTWLAIVPAVFVDGAAARGQLGTRHADLSAGAGVRLLVPKLVNTGLRFDAAFPLTSEDPLAPQASLGVFQFFYGGMPSTRW